MINETMQATYERWCSLAVEDEDVVKELQQMKGDPKALEDAFYKELSFGTGGLRGLTFLQNELRRFLRLRGCRCICILS